MENKIRHTALPHLLVELTSAHQNVLSLLHKSFELHFKYNKLYIFNIISTSTQKCILSYNIYQ